jgi:hypothetical protein
MRYRDTMTEAGLDVTETRYDYTDELDLDHLVGGVYSALPAQRLPPPDQRTPFADQIRRAVAPHAQGGRTGTPGALSTPKLAYAQLTPRS